MNAEDYAPKCSCGDEVAEPFIDKILKCKITPKRHCKACYMELTHGILSSKTLVHTMDTRTGGGKRIFRSEKGMQ